MVNQIYICNTVYQLLVIIQLKLTVHSENKGDLIITDSFYDSKQVAENVSGLRLFSNVYYIETKRVRCFKNDWRLISSRRVIRQLVAMNPNLKQLFSFQYDELLFANPGGLTLKIGSYLRRKNKKMLCSMFEDGIISYSLLYKKYINGIMNNKFFVKRLLYKKTGNPVFILGKYYVLEPMLMMWKPCEIYKIPCITQNKESFKKIVNSIFEIRGFQDEYKEKVIFFEESYVADGVEVSDVAVVKELEQLYGKEEILIKKHPRNSANTFEELGFKTNKNATIPWEVIALNIDLNTKILVTMTSTAVASTYLLLDAKPKMIFCYKGISLDNQRVNYTVQVIQRLEKLFPKAFSQI